MIRQFIFILLLNLTFFSKAIAQDSTDLLMDSLVKALTYHEKTDISLTIASLLKDDDWDRTLYYIEVAKNNAIKSGSDKIVANYNHEAGNLFFGKDALDIALEYYLKAYDYYKKNAPSKSSVELEQNIAITYGRINELEKARFYFKKLHTYAKKEKDTILIAKLLNNLGSSYLDSQIDSSNYYFQKAKKILDKVPKEMHLKAYLNANMGRAYFFKDSLGEAEKHFLLSASYIEKDTGASARSLGWIYNTISTYYEKTNQLDTAIAYAKKANLALIEKEFSFENQAALQTLYKSYLQKEDYKNSAYYFQEYESVRDSLDLEKKTANLEKIKVEQKYKAKEEIRKLQDSKRKFRNYVLVLSLLAILLLLSMLVVRFRNKLKSTKLEKQLALSKQRELDSNLQLKNKELIGKAMIEIHRTEIIEEILLDLKKVKRRVVKKETQQAIDFIAKRLKRDGNSNIWEEFEMRFERVHESFYENLSIKHPELTAGDKRLCALLKLNLTSKEIAQITGKTPKSVENARTRLRKKLAITHSNTDLSFYLSNLNR
ncbi:MAG: helix-turn-helix transcriptional regulator [Psychroflexus sp.]|uniref:helix-turn-helix transcriptional regulator n=1 Tax=Psychroflexus sp. S27 TaxID=1982757 RepID=UPI000C2A81B0|nr:hypothetical protein [Psychroflexus sp. S27]PJX22881.1 hypothetical protein CAP47_07625 [Psychroflexus sp. S27]